MLTLHRGEDSGGVGEAGGSASCGRATGLGEASALATSKKAVIYVYMLVHTVVGMGMEKNEQ